MIRPLSETVFVSAQIRMDDIATIAASGVTLIVNNRPDGEEAGQPTGAEIEAAARAAGLDYAFIPISGAFPGDKVVAMGATLADAEGKALIFCKSGTRSTFLWALALAGQGADADELVRDAARAGYDLRPILLWLKGEA